MKLSSAAESGTSLPELMISALLLATFFASIFEVNAVCLRLVSGSKENVAAIQGVQDRLETLRNLSYIDLTDANYLATKVMTAPSNVSSLAEKAAEEVTVVTYDTDNPIGGTIGTGIKLTRPPGASATPTVVSTDNTVPNSKAVLVTVKYTWRMALGGRSRVEETSSIVSGGVKK
jgi:Tfp pilus assembly protein PilV